MDAITKNPFRILGVLSNSSERDIQKNKARLSAYLDVNKQTNLENDFPCLGSMQRTKENVDDALSAIEINKNKLLYALFWFVDINHLDDPAFNHLREGNVSKALEIWSKATNSSDVTSKNYSSYNNLGTLKIATSFNNGSVNTTSLYEGISSKLKVIESEGLKELAKKVTDETYLPDPKSISEAFINKIFDDLEPFLKDSADFDTNSLIALFADGSQDVNSILQDKFTKDPIHRIESEVESAKRNRKANPSKGYELGKKLYSVTKDDLLELQEFFDSSDLKYQIVADKLANEVMQCGIDYFQETKTNQEKNPGEDAKELVKYAERIAVGTQTKQRIDENKKGLNEWIKNKPLRQKENRVKSELDVIFQQLDKFNTVNVTINNAKQLAKKCKPELQSMKQKLGGTDELYLKISSAIVSNAMGMTVMIVNSAQEVFSKKADFERQNALGTLRAIIDEAYEIMNYLGNFDMNSSLKSQYRQNKSTITDIRNNISGGSSGSFAELIKWIFIIGFLIVMAQTCN